MKYLIGMALCAAFWTCSARAEADPCVRTFVWPKRLVWQTDGCGYGTRYQVVKPFLGDLAWTEGSMATPFGSVRVRAEKTPGGGMNVKVSAPPQVTVAKEGHL